MSAIIRWNPVREMAAMQNAMDRLFNENVRNWPSFASEDQIGSHALALDVHENDQSYTVVTELPGVKAENINVKWQDGVLLIQGELPEETIKQEGKKSLLQERRYGKFSRSVRLPQLVDSSKVEATFENGILTLTLPKAEEAQPRLIPVKTTTSKN
jgi:HSP20 family protein